MSPPKSQLTETQAPLRLLRLPEVRARTGLPTSSLYRQMATGEFPRCVPLGHSAAVGWLENEVDSWLAAQVARRNAKHGDTWTSLGVAAAKIITKVKP
jgi:prophage regulatory protein